MSGHEKKPTEQDTLTSCRRYNEGPVRKRKGSNRAVHSPTGNGRGRKLSGHGKELTERGALTSWRRQRKGLVRTQDKTDRSRRTYCLETSEVRSCQDTESNRPIEAHLLPGDIRGRDSSRHGIKPTDRGALTSCDIRGRDLSRHGIKPTERGTLTPWRWQKEGLVRT